MKWRFTRGLVLTLGASAALTAILASLTARAELSADILGTRVFWLSPRGFCLLGLAPLLAWAPSWSLARLPPARLWTSLVARTLALGLVASAISEPVTRSDSTRRSVAFLFDVSESISDTALQKAHEWAKPVLKGQEDVVVHALTFAGRTTRLSGDEPSLPRDKTREGAQSDLESATLTALAILPRDTRRKVVILSDGRETRGSLLRAAERLRSHDAELDWVDLGDTVPLDVAIEDLTVPTEIKAGEPFFVRIRLRSTAPSRVRISLRQNGIPNGLEASKELTVDAGIKEAEMRSISYAPGKLTYEAKIEVLSTDAFAQNNQFSRTANVQGKPQILYVEGVPQEGRPFAELLRAAGFDVDQRSASGTPTRASELSPFDFYILSNVPSDALSLGAVDAISAYVEAGGSFLMAGGDQGFGLGGYRGSKMEGLLPVRLDTERRRDQPTLALMLVIDKSGSMSGQKIELAKEAARATADLLGADDYLGVLGFDAQPTRVVRLQTAGNKLLLAKGISRLTSGGGTAIFPALDAAYEDLSAVRAKLKHVILLTDGQTQEEGIPVLVQSMQVDGITVSSIGLGDDVARSLLEEIARIGGGRSYFTNDASNIPRLFVKETNAVSRSAAVEDYVGLHVASPAEFLRGVPLENAPFLRGYVATRARPAPAQAILVSDLDEPILARVRLGLGWSLAWTSDLTPRWSADWLRWSKAPMFWGQLIREHLQKHDEHPWKIESKREGDTLIATIDALDDAEHFVHGLEGTVSAERAGASDKAQSARLREVLPGRYEARFPLSELGAYGLRATLRGEGTKSQNAEGTFSYPFASEYAKLGVARELLQQAAQVTGGSRLERPHQVFDSRKANLLATTEQWSRWLWAALVAYLADLTARRLRWPFRRTQNQL